MRGNGWCEQVLKALAAYFSRMNCLITGKFSSVGKHGMGGGVDGGAALLGHWHGWSVFPGMPLFEQGGSVADILVMAAAIRLACLSAGKPGCDGWQDPMLGKSGGIVCSCLQQSWDR